jgi:hypothetical protein
MPSQRPSSSKDAPAVRCRPDGPAEKEWEGSDSSDDEEDAADQTIRLHTNHLDQEVQDAGESVNFDSLLPAAEMVEGSKAGGMAREANAVTDGVPNAPCSADHGGACQRCCDQGGTLAARRDLTDFMGPPWEIVVPNPEPSHNPFGDPVHQPPPARLLASGRRQTLCGSVRSLTRHASFADRLKMPQASDVLSSVAPELAFRQGFSRRSHKLYVPDRYAAFREGGIMAHAGLIEMGRIGRGRGIYTRTDRTGSLAPRPGVGARQSRPMKRKALVGAWEHAQRSVQRPSLSDDATAARRGGHLSVEALRHRHRHFGVSPGTHLDGRSRAGGPRLDGQDLRPLSGDSTSSAAQGSETPFDPAGPACLLHSTAGTLGALQPCAAPALVAEVAVANSPWYVSGNGRAGGLLIEVRFLRAFPVGNAHVF